jgi:hypothetical protein
MTRHRLWIPALAALLLAVPAWAGTSGAAGWWTGDIEMPTGPLSVQVELTAGEDGSWTGAISIPVQGIRHLPLEKIEAGENGISFEMQGVAGDPRFVGSLAEDGRSMSGDFHHGKFTFPFRLDRRDEPFEDDYALFEPYFEPGVPGEGVEGTWLGIMNAGIAKLRMDLVLTRGDSGSLGGTLASPDQGSDAIPLDSVGFEGDDVTFSVGSIGGHFEGKLSPDGSAMMGRWSQGMANFTVVFQRQGERKAAEE